MESINIHYPILAFPGSLAIVGSSYSGKSTLLSKIIKYKNELFTTIPGTVIYCYAEEPSAGIGEIDNVILFKGLPDKGTLDDWMAMYEHTNILLALDDLFNEFLGSD